MRHHHDIREVEELVNRGRAECNKHIQRKSTGVYEYQKTNVLKG
jgi:hypothetical protein